MSKIQFGPLIFFFTQFNPW